MPGTAPDGFAAIRGNFVQAPILPTTTRESRNSGTPRRAPPRTAPTLSAIEQSDPDHHDSPDDQSAARRGTSARDYVHRLEAVGSSPRSSRSPSSGRDRLAVRLPSPASPRSSRSSGPSGQRLAVRHFRPASPRNDARPSSGSRGRLIRPPARRIFIIDLPEQRFTEAHFLPFLDESAATS